MPWLLVIFLVGLDGKMAVEGHLYEDKRQCEGMVAPAREHFGERFIAARCVLGEAI